MGIYKIRTEFGHQLKLWLGFLALIFIVGAAFSFGPSMFGGGKDREGGYSNEVVAEVNGAKITRGDFDKSWEAMYEKAKNQGIYSPLQLAYARQQIFSQLVNTQLLLSAAKDMGVDVSDRKVNDEVDKYVTMYLQQNRRTVLGNISKDEEKIDPRDDKDYKDALSKNGYSLGQEEDIAKQNVPVDTIRSQVAIKGIQDKIRSQVKPSTAKDVTDSYNVYKVRQIVLLYKGAKSQIDNKADKILAEAKSGKDFAELAKQNTDMPDKKTGGAAVYSYETRMMFPQEMRDAIAQMKPGDVSPVIKTDMGVAIVKLESMSQKLPAKFDRKVQDQRRKDIDAERLNTALMDFGKKMQAKQKVTVKDPELLGYWSLTEAQSAMMDPVKYKEDMKTAEDAFTKVKDKSVYAVIMLAQIKQQDGKAKEAIGLLEPILEGKNATAEGADLRMMLGNLYLQQKMKDKAINQYVQASEVAQQDVNMHQQILEKFKQLNKPELAAKEQKTIADLQARLKAAQPASPKTSGAPAQKAPKAAE